MPLLFFYSSGNSRYLHSFPTRRSSDLGGRPDEPAPRRPRECPADADATDAGTCQLGDRDRKSTRLNSSHTVISYAVFCLKKKKQHIEHHRLVGELSKSGLKTKPQQPEL